MAIVTAINADWTAQTGKTLSKQSVLNSQILEVNATVTIGMCCNYPGCAAGYTVDLSFCGRVATIIEVNFENMEVGASCCTLLVSRYEYAACCAAATGTLHLFEGTCAVTPLGELPNCATCATCKVVRVHVIGF